MSSPPSADPRNTSTALIVSDVIVEGEFLRISDEEMRKAVDEMTELALHTVTS